MSSVVHYRFKASKEVHSVNFSGMFIKAFDLKVAIVEQRNMHKGLDFDLEIKNSTSSEVYGSDMAMIPKNATVVVRRIPPPGKHNGLLARIQAATEL
ncbi:unnamed protein product, partial [Phaeothamnion confervicola]